MDVVAQAKNIGVVLATASALAYASGYLALRARAHALGTDPTFKLVDEIYVFAGFRFLYMALLTLLLAAPLILGILWVARSWMRLLPIEYHQPIQWGFLILLAISTVLATLKVLGVSGVLMRNLMGPNENTAMEAAVLGNGSSIGLILNLIIVVLTSLTGLWLYSRLTNLNSSFSILLINVAALQVILLPVCHGAFFADRKIRVLAEAPETVLGLESPLGIVDRVADDVTLFGFDSEGNGRLVTVKFEDVKGIPTTGIKFLRDFIANAVAIKLNEQSDTSIKIPTISASQKRETEGMITQGENTKSGHSSKEASPVDEGRKTEVEKTPSEKVEKGFFARLVEELSISLTAIGSLGGGDVEFGELWTAHIDETGRVSEPHRIGTVDDIAWPVMDSEGKKVFAIQQRKLIRLNLRDNTITTVEMSKSWYKLLGVDANDQVFALVWDKEEMKPAIWMPQGEILLDDSPLNETDEKRIALLLQEARAYAGDRTLFVDRSERGGRGFDVLLKVGDKTINLSNCGDDSCGQASLSADFKHVLFVRKPR